MKRSWLSGAVAAMAAVTLTGCAGDSNSALRASHKGGAPWHGPLVQGHGAAVAGMAPGCGPGFDVTPTGGSYNESGTLAETPAGQAVTITVTMRVQRTTIIRRLRLIVGRPGTTSGAGAVSDSPLDSMLREENQAAVVDLYRGPAKAGQKFTATVTLNSPGRYPVEAVATSLSPGLCGGIQVRGGEGMQSAQPIGFIAVH